MSNEGPTRGQVKRALDWLEYLAKPRLKRGTKNQPRCVTCGVESRREFAKGQPAYDCGPHPAFRISPELLERARRELRPERKRD